MSDLAYKVAYLQAQALCAQIEMAAMQAANMDWYSKNLQGKPPYTEADFMFLTEKYGLHHNAVISWLRGG